MSIANDLNDVVEASGDMLARLAILPTIFPTNGLLPPLPPCQKRPLSADAAYLLIWSCGSSWGWPFSAMSPSPRSLGASTSVQKGWPMMPCSRTVPCLQARQRLGKQPLEWLFKQCADVWGGTLS